VPVSAIQAGAYNPVVSAELVSSALLLFLVVDPIGNIPIVLAAMAPVAGARRSRVLLREVAFATLLLLLFLFFGKLVLDTLRLSELSLRIAGGVVLFLIALRMIFPTEGGVMGEPIEGEPFIVPLAIPLLAGPSALSAILVLARTAPERTLGWLGALTLAWAASAAILLSSNLFYRLLRRRGLVALERLMGMVLVMLAVQMFLDGLAQRSLHP